MYRRKYLRQKEVRSLLSEVTAELHLGEEILSMKDHVQVLTVESDEIILVNGTPKLVRGRNHLVPSLVERDLLAKLPKVTVDMGAVPHVCNGADVMARGVTRTEGDFAEGSIVVVVDQNHGKPLAVGVALVGSSSMTSAGGGKVVRNHHYVGDKLWETMKGIA